MDNSLDQDALLFKAFRYSVTSGIIPGYPFAPRGPFFLPVPSPGGEEPSPKAPRSINQRLSDKEKTPMGAVEIIVFIVAIILMLLGVAGAFLPVIPGVPLNFVVFLAFGFYDRWESYGFWIMFFMGFLAVVSVVFDQLAGALGAKKFGAQKAGMIGSVLGAILGLIVFNIPGLILGTFLGAVAAEMIFNKKEIKEASNAGLGALVGCLCGSVFKFVISFFMTALFVYLVLNKGA